MDAITLFGDKNTLNVVLEKSYQEYMEGFTDQATGAEKRGFIEVVKELEEREPLKTSPPDATPANATITA